MKRRTLLLAVAALTACASMNDAMTPSLQSKKDLFDGSELVFQEPVSAAASLGEAWHVLGMDWNSKTPDIVFVTAGVQGTASLQGLAFNVDGRIIDNLQAASQHTEFSAPGDLVRSSRRRFSMSWQDFKSLAAANDVKMRVSSANTYSVSSFGASTQAAIQAKLGPFVARVSELRRALGRPD